MIADAQMMDNLFQDIRKLALSIEFD